MVDWRHRVKGVALLVAVLALVGAVVARNPRAIGVAVSGLLVFGVAAMFVALAWLSVTAANED